MIDHGRLDRPFIWLVTIAFSFPAEALKNSSKAERLSEGSPQNRENGLENGHLVAKGRRGLWWAMDPIGSALRLAHKAPLYLPNMPDSWWVDFFEGSRARQALEVAVLELHQKDGTI